MSLWNTIKLPLKILVPGAAIIAAIIVFKPTPQISDKQPDKAESPIVSVVYANPSQQQITVSAQGTVEPRREIDLVAQVAGKITSVDEQFVNGGAFESKQLLIKIEDTDYKVALIRAKAALANAEKLLAQEKGLGRQAKREWRELGNQEANSLFLREPQIKAAQADITAAKAEVEMAELNLARTEISVPFDGRVRDTLVDLGQYVSPGTKLARVYDTSVAQIRLPLTDSNIALLDLAAINSDQQEKPVVTVEGVIGGQMFQWQGQLVRTEASLDIRSRMYYAVVEVKDPYQQKHQPLMVGMFVNALLTGKPLDNVVKLPRDALFKQNQLYALTADNDVVLNKVTVLNRSKDYVWVRAESLTNNTAVVARDQVYITPGINVRIEGTSNNIDEEAETQIAAGNGHE